MKNNIQILIVVGCMAVMSLIHAEEGHKHHDHSHEGHKKMQAAATIDPAHVVKEVGKYPLKVCPVSGEPLGSMGNPIVVKQDGREVQLCCKGCTKKLVAEPAKYLAKLDAAVIAQQKESYPLKTCIVSLDDLKEGETIDYAATNNQLFRLCCKMCKKELEENLEKFTGELEKARKK